MRCYKETDVRVGVWGGEGSLKAHVEQIRRLVISQQWQVRRLSRRTWADAHSP